MFSVRDVKKAQKGNKNAFVHIVKEVEETLYQVSKSILRNDEDTADAIQETILKAYQSIHSLRDPSIFKTWIVRIVINSSYDILRKNKKVVPMQEWMEQASTDHTDFEVTDAIQLLEEELRVPVALFYLEDWKIQDIANLLQIPEGTVKSRLSRARKKLSYYLGSENERGVQNGNS